MTDTKKIDDGGLADELIDAAAAVCRGLGIASTPTNCFPIIEGLKAYRERDQWQPIETAPKDGTNILVWADGYEWPEVARYELYSNHDIEEESGEPGFWRYSDDLFADVCEIEEGELSHWMPLPPPPRALQQKGSSNG